MNSRMIPKLTRGRDCPPPRVLVAALALVLLAAGRPAPAAAASFQTGDLYLASNGLPGGVGSGVLRIDPTTGSASLVVDLVLSSANSSSYDPFRDRILLIVGTPTGGLIAMDPAGSFAPLAPGAQTPSAVASRGDGLIYLWYSSVEGFSYMDAAGAIHDLKDQSGTGRFGFGAGRTVQEMLYDRRTNSLVCATGSFASACASADLVCLVRIPLTADGSQVAGPIQSSQFDVSSSAESVVGMSSATGGNLLITVDTNSNDGEPRMVLLDPATMTATAYASNGGYTGAAATNAGTYSQVLGAAVVLDTFADKLRRFSFGEVGTGTLFGDPVSAGFSSGETAQLIEINLSTLVSVPPAPGAETGSALEFAPLSPNPARGDLTFRFRLSADQPVSLAIHDLSGRLVRTLLSGAQLGQGNHAEVWDQRDVAGRRVPVGMYLCRLRAGESERVRRVFVVR